MARKQVDAFLSIALITTVVPELDVVVACGSVVPVCRSSHGQQ